jgi:signal transduction histidine kinase
LPLRKQFGIGLSWIALTVMLTSSACVFGADDLRNKQISQPPEGISSSLSTLGSWIWTGRTFDGQVCHFWKAIDIPASGRVLKADLFVTADNDFTFFLDGQELGHAGDWRELFKFDLTRAITPGNHVLAIEARNSTGGAGVILGMRILFENGELLEIKSDETWRIVPGGTKGWKTMTSPPKTWPSAKVVGTVGGLPWWKQPTLINAMPTPQFVHKPFWQRGWFQIVVLSFCGLVILVSLRLAAQLAMHRKERALLQRERARIAREIHDDIGSRMTQLVLHGEVAQGGLPENSETRQQLAQISEEARALLSTMDEILWAVNPQRDTLRDFAGYVTNYTEEYLRPSGVQCLFEIDPEMASADLTLPLRRNLLMAIKEALNNVVKHSGATELRLHIGCEKRRLVVVVQDNGKGFDMKHTKPQRHGLTNLCERMVEFGGTCEIVTQPGKGCRVEFNVPVGQSRQSWLSRFFKTRSSTRPANSNPSASAKAVEEAKPENTYAG